MLQQSTPNKIKEVVIPREQALFWLDANGCWHNTDGKFRHKKIIDFFHRSIKKDARGYYLGQQHGHVREKVYFHYEDTALFVFDVITNGDIKLVLNTGKRIKLMPRNLFIKNDHLYMHKGGERIKFTERALLKIAARIDYENGRYFIRVKNRKYRLQQQ